jgi:hypothetical protein
VAERAHRRAIPAKQGVNVGVYTTSCARFEARRANTIVDAQVTNLIGTGALLALSAARQALAGGAVTIGEARAAHAIRAAVTDVQTYADLTNVAERAHRRAIPAKQGVNVGVYTTCCARFEAWRADTIVDAQVTNLIATDALLALSAARQALAGGAVTIGDAAAAHAIRAAVTGIHAIPYITDVSDSTRGIAVTAVPGISLGVHAVEAAERERGAAVDPATIGYRGIEIGAGIVRGETSIGYAPIQDGHAGVGRQDARIVDAL